MSENGLKLAVNVFTGDQTGLYLDRRAIRQRIAELAPGQAVLDLCSYSAACGLSAARAGAAGVTAVDNSAQAMGLARKSLELNGLNAFNCKLVKDDATRFLNQDETRYDLIILDPPAGEEEDWVKLNALALRHLKPGGRLFSLVSQHSNLSEDVLLRIVNKAALQAERQIRVIESLRQGPDFPYLPGHPEGRNLFGALIFAD
ncbi:MAG: Ribosomal RNA large subunit methyltransferase I [Deltaproteobacteria bacterium ADurb.Bin510]|nr:MAG: Ribosomal RNA large subunit methyltransferase I [Deltaproteobacteria bacterium ADurb.Bin510]